MIKLLQQKILIALTAFMLLIPLSGLVLAPSFAYADDSSQAACEGIGLVGSSNGCATSSGDPAGDSIDKLVTKIVNILSWVVGVVAVIMIIIAGFRYITSGGDSNKVSSAKGTLIYAIVGMVIVVLAQVIVHFVINTAGNAG